MKRLLVILTAWVIRLVGATIRVTLDDRAGILNRPDHPPIIMAFWHNRVALMAYYNWRYCWGRNSVTFISRSRDGQFITDVAAQLGIKAVRGSSSRHGQAAMLAALRAAEDPRTDLVLTPDGPRGPRYEIKPGLLRLAQATKRPIVAITYVLPRRFELKSWDRFHLPLPFSRCRLITNDLISVPEAATEVELAAISARVAESLGGD
jgi:lysophospholipid acyltransferase (LPLAT)-like uncharacterized protein